MLMDRHASVQNLLEEDPRGGELTHFCVHGTPTWVTVLQ